MVTAFGACSSDDGTEHWGEEAQRFFDSWSADWDRGDPFATVRYYSPNVSVSLAQPDLELTFAAATFDSTTRGDGRTWLAEWLAETTRSTDRSLAGVFLDQRSAGVMMVLDDLDTAALFEMEMADGLIGSQRMLRWRYAYKPGGVPDPRLAWIDNVIEEYTARADLSVADVTAGAKRHPAVFVAPSPDTDVVAFVVDGGDECGARTLIRLDLNGDTVTEERRSLETGAPGTCGRAEGGWWNGLEIPVHLENQISGSVELGNGREVTVFNGTPGVHGLLEWGLERFRAAGLAPPNLGSVTFGPVPACARYSGIVTENVDGPADLVHCVDAYDVCDPTPASCSSLRAGARFSFLHELAHAWMLDNVDFETQDRFLESRSLARWEGADVPWHERGSEQAAETVAWGVMDSTIALARIGNPSCEELRIAYRTLTGLDPLRVCAAD